MSTVIEKLKEFGFNSYEAKVYIALLKKYPSTGYEISQIADIPQSRAYDALKSLEAESVVFSTKEKPQKFSPISPKELTNRFKRRLNSSLEYLEKKLPEVKENYNEPIHMIYGYDNIIEKIKEVIKNAKNSIFIELWGEDYKLLESNFANAYSSGVEIKLVSYGTPIVSRYAAVYQHEGSKEIEKATGSRMIYLLSDNEETIFGRIENQVVWTKNNDIAFLMKEFIVHDIYLLDVYQNFPEQLKYFYGPGFRKLKDKVLDKYSSYGIH